MASREEHINLSIRNEKLADSNLLSKPENLDWKLTIKYYSMVHLLDSTYTDGEIYPHPDNHNDRKIQIEATHGKSLLSTYKVLERLSRTARYECSPITIIEIEQANRLIEIIKDKLNKNKKN